MAKKDAKGNKDKQRGVGEAVDAIRSGLERALEGAGLTEKRQHELADQVSAAAGRIRHTLEDLRVVDEVRDMRIQLEALASRVAELESSARSRAGGSGAKSGARTARSGAATSRARSASSSSRATSARATKPKSASTKSSAKSSGTSSRAKSARPRSGGSSSS